MITEMRKHALHTAVWSQAILLDREHPSWYLEISPASDAQPLIPIPVHEESEFMNACWEAEIAQRKERS